VAGDNIILIPAMVNASEAVSLALIDSIRIRVATDTDYDGQSNAGQNGGIAAPLR
jgi:hypothetical protein